LLAGTRGCGDATDAELDGCTVLEQAGTRIIPASTTMPPTRSRTVIDPPTIHRIGRMIAGQLDLFSDIRQMADLIEIYLVD
jgi:hypothetical protein